MFNSKATDTNKKPFLKIFWEKNGWKNFIQILTSFKCHHSLPIKWI